MEQNFHTSKFLQESWFVHLKYAHKSCSKTVEVDAHKEVNNKFFKSFRLTISHMSSCCFKMFFFQRTLQTSVFREKSVRIFSLLSTICLLFNNLCSLKLQVLFQSEQHYFTSKVDWDSFGNSNPKKTFEVLQN